MPPTLGRIVHYRDGNGVVQPAVVCAVHSDNLVNLRILEDGPNIPWKTSVEKQDETEGASIGNRRWFWPPRVEG